LKRLGVDDYFVVADDRNGATPFRWECSRPRTRQRPALPHWRQGVKSATVGARETQAGKTYFQVSEANPALAAKLNELKQGFPGTEVRECAADEKKG